MNLSLKQASVEDWNYFIAIKPLMLNGENTFSHREKDATDDTLIY